MTDLSKYPPFEQWDDWTELDAKAWPDRVEKHYSLVPTSCFNCEAGCGLVCYMNHETGEIDKIEGNPEHPASRGRNCAKGPATLNQVYDPERVMYPMKRVGPRGSGEWERISWDVALDEIGARIRTAIKRVREATGADVGEERLREAVALLDRAATRRLVHPNRVARIKSGLARHVKALA